MNTETNQFALGLVEQAVQYIVRCVVHQITPEVNEAIAAAIAATTAKIDDKINAKIQAMTNSNELRQVIGVYVTDYMDDNRVISRMDESLDAHDERLDRIEDRLCNIEEDEGTGMSRKLKEEIENIVQDKFDGTEFVVKDGLSEAVAEVISSGSFSFNRY